MSKRRLWMIATVLVAILAVPRTGSAGIGEWIWEMSGPSMLGFTSGCSLSLSTKTFHRCSVLSYPTQRLPTSPGRVWLVLDGSTYFSLGKNAGEGADESEFRAFRTFMQTFDPMLGFKSGLGEHSVGVSYNFVFGQDFRRFSNIGVKLRPLVVRWAGLDWEWNIRLYPDGFDVVEGSNPAALLKGRDFEVVHAIGVTIPFGP